jgi:hypothetical protein
MPIDYKSAFYAAFHTMADEAGQIARPLFRSGHAVETKDDQIGRAHV